MSTQRDSRTSDPKEERAYAKALGHLMAHVGKCPDCGQLIRTMAGSDAPQLLDLADPKTPLCHKGVELRATTDDARSLTPAERLIAAYELESGDVPAIDQHDAKRGAAWLREDPGRARIILEKIEAGSRCLIEDRPESAADQRAAFLKGFRQVSPSRGPAPTEEQRVKRAAAADRLCTVIFDRYEKRHGKAPPVDVASAFRRGHDLWIMDGTDGTDLEKMADDAEAFRVQHASLWAKRSILPPKSAAEELKKIARWIADGLIRDEAEKG